MVTADNYTMNYKQPAEYHFSLDSVILPNLVAKEFLPQFYLSNNTPTKEPLASQFAKDKELKPQIISVLKVLDLCSGVGVIGIEFIFHWVQFVKNLKSIPKNFCLEIHFLEVQAAYKEYFEENIQIMKKTLEQELLDSGLKINIHFHLINYKDFNLRSIPIKESKIDAHCLDEFDLAGDSASPFDLILSNPPYFQKNQGRLSPSDLKNRSRFYLDSDFETFCQLLPELLKPGSCANMVFRSLQEHKSDLFLKMHLLLCDKGVVTEKENIRTAKWISFTKK